MNTDKLDKVDERVVYQIENGSSVFTCARKGICGELR
jgi:hypothetical protein